MPAKLFRPYQPFLLRILHGLTGLFVIAAILTAFWTYDVYDGRWGRIPLPELKEIEGIHGTFGLYALLVFPLFAVYAFHRGHKRLIQPDSVAKLGQLGKPIGWYTLHRAINTLILLALTFAVFSGKMMDETWLPRGELDHNWYYAHLVSWVVMVVCIGLHLLMSAKVGGIPLLLSIFSYQFRPQDSPGLWRENILQWWEGWRLTLTKEWLKLSFPLKILEVVVLMSIAAAWIVSLLKELG